jgi:cell division protein FtsA
MLNMTSRSQPQPQPLQGLLDIGTSKIVCVALAPARAGLDDAQPHIAAVGVSGAEGIKAGEIVDPVAAAAAVQRAMQDAERMSGAPMHSVLIAAGCGRLSSLTATVETKLDPAIVCAENLARLSRSGRTATERDGRILLHLDFVGYRLDGAATGHAPRDRFGRHLEADLHAVTADPAPIRRLLEAVEASGVSATGIVPAPLPSAYAVTTKREREEGIAVVDLGAGTTGVAIIAAGRLRAIHGFALGGRALTQDVARALQVPLSIAERIKIEYASVGIAHAGEFGASVRRSNSDLNADYQQVALRPAADTDATRAALRLISNAHIDTLLRLIADQLDALAYVPKGIGRVVLTGGGSELHGLAAYAARILGRPVRTGRPLAAFGAGAKQFDRVCGPAFATAAGLIEVVQDQGLGVRFARAERDSRRRVG